MASEYEESCRDRSYSQEDLPNNLNFGVGVEFINQVVSYDRVVFWQYI